MEINRRTPMGTFPCCPQRHTFLGLSEAPMLDLRNERLLRSLRGALGRFRQTQGMSAFLGLSLVPWCASLGFSEAPWSAQMGTSWIFHVRL